VPSSGPIRTASSPTASLVEWITNPGVPGAVVRSRVATRDRSCARPTAAVAELVATQPEAPQRWYPRVERWPSACVHSMSDSRRRDNILGDRRPSARRTSTDPPGVQRPAPSPPSRSSGSRHPRVSHGPSAGGRASATPPTGVAEAARREGVSQTAIANWRDDFLNGGCSASRRPPSPPGTREAPSWSTSPTRPTRSRWRSTTSPRPAPRVPTMVGLLVRGAQARRRQPDAVRQ